MSGYLEYCREQLSGDTSKNDQAAELIYALGQMRSPEAGELLCELVDNISQYDPRRLKAVVRALAWQGTGKALPVLRSLAEQTTDVRQLKLIASAIRFLEL